MGRLSFAQAEDRLNSKALKIQAERECSYMEAFNAACEQAKQHDVEAYLVYFQKTKYLVSPQQQEEKKKKAREGAKKWQRVSDKLTRLANERVANGLAKDFAEGLEQARRAHPDLADVYDGKETGGE